MEAYPRVSGAPCDAIHTEVAWEIRGGVIAPLDYQVSNRCALLSGHEGPHEAPAPPNHPKCGKTRGGRPGVLRWEAKEPRNVH